MLYYAFIHSHLLYGVEIYANSYHSRLHKLIVLNNKILRVLLKVPFDTPVINLHADFGALSLTELHNFQILQFVHKCIYRYHKLPQIFPTYFTKNSMFHTYNARTKEGLHIDFIRSSLGQRCIKYKGSVLWNCLRDAENAFAAGAAIRREG